MIQALAFAEGDAMRRGVGGLGGFSEVGSTKTFHFLLTILVLYSIIIIVIIIIVIIIIICTIIIFPCWF